MSERTPRLPPFPVDDFTLTQIEHALGTSYGEKTERGHELVGGDFTLSQYLDFLSGYDPDDGILVGYAGAVPIYEHVGGQIYSDRSVIGALVAEVRRLRAQYQAGLAHEEGNQP